MGKIIPFPRWRVRRARPDVPASNAGPFPSCPVDPEADLRRKREGEAEHDACSRGLFPCCPIDPETDVRRKREREAEARSPFPYCDLDVDY